VSDQQLSLLCNIFCYQHAVLAENRKITGGSGGEVFGIVVKPQGSSQSKSFYLFIQSNDICSFIIGQSGPGL
jgi:hypothetical protein